MNEARPGDEITVETVLAPYRGERVVRQISGQDSDLRQQRNACTFWSAMGTLSTAWPHQPRIRTQARSRVHDRAAQQRTLNNRLYVSLLEADPEARVADKVMPTLPICVMNVMDGMRGNQEMIVSGESNVDETATPSLDYVVSGAQLLTVTVK